MEWAYDQRHTNIRVFAPQVAMLGFSFHRDLLLRQVDLHSYYPLLGVSSHGSVAPQRGITMDHGEENE